ncbi:xaa-Pro aminopeptidase ApepP-like isoform X1 [Pomacea canaliculata]|uniref:xaa-Pro aminopeptidase ApepP-like isoform X1 n=1 Tax=Pomacea canaliculata TaxID=400727 RepID=UPI000D72972D|nr:xaa-Pro aminopeptidase ApepP-like isoform X1 [Pomacea canaliculata]
MWCCAAGLVYLLTVASLCHGGPIAGEGGHRTKREAGQPTLADRLNCSQGDRVNTTQRLADMRAAMRQLDIDAFIILSDDAHGSEYPSERDERRGFISGFTGSAGQAVVTLHQAALWTDGRYFLEAEGALDCNWIFMRSGDANVPSISQWVISELANTSGVVGADPFLVSNSQWQSFEKAFVQANITFKQVFKNPVDTAWGGYQPAPPMSNITALPMEFAGKTWQDKITELRQSMTAKNADVFVVTSLDETAWLFNLRGGDISYNPVFLSYAIVEKTSVRLYLLNKNERLTQNATDPVTSIKLKEHLNTGDTGSCTGSSASCVEVVDYNETAIVEDVKALATAGKKIWVTFVCNYAIFSAIPEASRIQDRSSIALAKAMKNQVEREGMERCYIRDSLILIKFLAFLEKEIKNGHYWTEVSAAERLKEMRLQGQYNRGLSFESISGSGPNGAVIHYRPLNATNRQITTTEMYLLDSGGQYLDGTTDVTRTMHFGTPSSHEKECYTRVLMGAIDLANLVWPQGLYGREIDMAARAPLWQVGLEYNHGTGHGIGAYLSVHEGPGRISLTHSANPSEETVHEYMFFSDEPGYYENGKFGIRLETIVMVEPTSIKAPSNKTFYRFKPMTLVPFEPNLIDTELLTKSQITWLNKYHELVWNTMKDNLTSEEERSWLWSRAQPIGEDTNSTTPAATTVGSSPTGSTPATTTVGNSPTGSSPLVTPITSATVFLVAAVTSLYL